MPTFVLVHGGRHSAWCWHLVQEALQARGLESVAPDLSLENIDQDAAMVRDLTDEIEDDVILVGHSRGGRVISVSAIGATNVARLIFLAANVNEPEVSVPGGPRPTEYRRLAQANSVLTAAQARQHLYHDVPDKVADEAIRRLRPSPPNTRAMTCDAPMAWHKLPTTYIVSSHDRCIDPDDQREMAQQMDETFEIPTGHTAFLSQPEVVAGILARYA